SEPKATAAGGRRRFGARRHDDDPTVEHRRDHGGLSDSLFAFGFGLDCCGLGQLARLDACDHSFGAAALLAGHLARDIAVEVDTDATSREAFLVRQTIDVSLQYGIDLTRAEHATRHQIVAYADLQWAVWLRWFG